MRAALVLTLSLVLLGTTSHGAAADGRTDRAARAHFAAGQTHFDLGEYDAAIESFQAGYRDKPLPLFLFNIAQAARKAGRTQLAIDSYARYLERESTHTAPQRPEAETWLAKLRRDQADARDRDKAAAESTPPPAPTPSPALTPPPSEPAPATVTLTPAPTRPADRPVYKKGWFWGTLAAVVVVGAGAGVGTWLALDARTPAKPSLGAVQFDGGRIHVGGAFDVLLH